MFLLGDLCASPEFTKISKRLSFLILDTASCSNGHDTIRAALISGPEAINFALPLFSLPIYSIWGVEQRFLKAAG
jgi:hypothetical protein